MADKYLTKQQVMRVLGSLPPDADKAAAIGRLIEGGYKLEGYQEAGAQRTSSQPSTQQSAPKEQGSFLGDLGRAIVKPVLNTATTGIRAGQGLVRLMAGQGASADRDVNKPISFGLLGTGEAMKAGRDVTDRSSSNPFSLATTGRTIGTGIELGSMLSGGGAAKNVATSAARVPMSSLIKQGASQGFKIGAAGGLGSGLSQKDATLGSILGSTAAGGVLGAGIGAAGGALSSKLTAGGRAMSQAQKTVKSENKILDVITPKLDKKTISSALKRGDIGVEEATLLQGNKVKATDFDRKVARSIADVIDPKAQPIENITKLNNKIVDISENEVTPFLQQNAAIYNKNVLKNRLNALKENLPLSYKTDQQLERIYNNVIDEALKSANQAKKKDMLGLWLSRKQFDKTISREFGDKVLKQEAKSARDVAVNDVRTAINDFISEHTPNNQFKQFMERLNHMYVARDRIVDNAVKGFDKGKLRQYLDKNPNISKLVSVGLGGGVAGGIIGNIMK